MFFWENWCKHMMILHILYIFTEIHFVKFDFHNIEYFYTYLNKNQPRNSLDFFFLQMSTFGLIEATWTCVIHFFHLEVAPGSCGLKFNIVV